MEKHSFPGLGSILYAWPSSRPFERAVTDTRNCTSRGAEFSFSRCLCVGTSHAFGTVASLAGAVSLTADSHLAGSLRLSLYKVTSAAHNTFVVTPEYLSREPRTYRYLVVELRKYWGTALAYSICSYVLWQHFRASNQRLTRPVATRSDAALHCLALLLRIKPTYSATQAQR
jgi:hypothetical protein